MHDGVTAQRPAWMTHPRASSWSRRASGRRTPGASLLGVGPAPPRSGRPGHGRGHPRPTARGRRPGLRGQSDLNIGWPGVKLALSTGYATHHPRAHLPSSRSCPRHGLHTPAPETPAAFLHVGGPSCRRMIVQSFVSQSGPGGLNFVQSIDLKKVRPTLDIGSHINAHVQPRLCRRGEVPEAETSAGTPG